ncbi:MULTISPECIES: SCO0930 family lipoprotein [Streptomyces]|uniref:SCO0930 family lipoprotein n=1 Tax=Streptomyces silvae TaxID=2803812 RepID=A0ABU8AE32_9ACTN|nr:MULTISPECIES: SCO0930 family lipoprotein [unclassified Streptomyces]MDX3324913.1 SCO0930 family lipoprotein [Streptomyces sp. ME02-6979-3A]MDX3432062.1 SCO0930 family lipoprotein [Streptomyces sp. ME01-18a]
MNTWRNASLAVTAVALLALTTACGQEKGTASPNGQAVGNAAPAQQPADSGYGSDGGYGSDVGADTAPKEAGQLAVWDSQKLGKVLTDSEGFTLYRFDKDTAEPPASNCESDCAKAWPAVPAEKAEAAAGVGASLIGEVTRADGTKQLTVGGWPMYRYAEDAEPGDANGQGVGGTWFAAAPDGKKAAVNADGPSGAQADAAGLSVRKDPELGNIVVDKRGMTVYRFKKDSAWPMKSACTGDCLKKWPVVAPVPKNDVDGVTTKGFVTFDRPDGIQQQSLDCWPVYTFSGDAEPGDTNGQGVGGTWYAVSPDAKLVGAAK